MNQLDRIERLNDLSDDFLQISWRLNRRLLALEASGEVSAEDYEEGIRQVVELRSASARLGAIAFEDAVAGAAEAIPQIEAATKRLKRVKGDIDRAKKIVTVITKVVMAVVAVVGAVAAPASTPGAVAAIGDAVIAIGAAV